jgi:ketosteroid isomerase-like protein
VVALFDPAIEWREAESNPYQPDGAPWVGADAIVQNLFVRLGTERMASRFRRHLYGAGDTVVAECRYTGTYQSMGRSLDAQACHVWKLRDGKIVSFQQYADTAQLQDVMGTREAAQPATAPASA